MIVVEKIYERGADSSPVTETAPPLSRVVITATMQCDHPLILFHKYFIFLEMNISYRGTHLQLPRSTFIKLLPITINWFISFPNPVKAANLSNSSISIPAFPQDGYWALTRSSALQPAGDSRHEERVWRAGAACSSIGALPFLRRLSRSPLSASFAPSFDLRRAGAAVVIWTRGGELEWGKTKRVEKIKESSDEVGTGWPQSSALIKKNNDNHEA